MVAPRIEAALRQSKAERSDMAASFAALRAALAGDPMVPGAPDRGR